MRFVANMAEEEFLQDEKTQYAVVRSLEIIGEAANNVSAETRDRFVSLSWSKIIAQARRDSSLSEVEFLTHLGDGSRRPPAGHRATRCVLAGAPMTSLSFIGAGNMAEAGEAGRNDPCPCGSEKRYKKCHGRAA